MESKLSANALIKLTLMCLAGITLVFMLAALPASAEQAWADESVKQVTEDMIEPGLQTMSPSDLPGFTNVSHDDAKALYEEYVKYGGGYLIYSIDADGTSTFINLDAQSMIAPLDHNDVLEIMKTHPVFYTTGGPAYTLRCQVWDVPEKKPEQGGTVSDGGDYKTFIKDTFHLNDEVTLTAKPDEGYEFIGWVGNFKEGDDAAAAEADITDNPYTFTIDQNTIVLAQFQKQVHTVTFDSMGGTDVPKAQVTHGDTVAYPIPGPEKAGNFNLINWYTDKDHANVFDFDTPITEDITLYAGWGYILDFVTAGDDYGEVSIDSGEPGSSVHEEVFEGATVTLKATTPMQSLFVNITCKDTGEVLSTDPEYVFVYDGSMTDFVANYKPNMTTLTFDPNGGHVGPEAPPHTADIRVGGSFVEKKVPTSKDQWATPPDGYVFDGYQIIDDRNNVHTYKPGDDVEYIYIGPTVIKMMWAPKSSDAVEEKSDNKNDNANGSESSAQSDSQGKSQSPKTGDPLSATLPLTVSAIAALVVLALCSRKLRGSR